MSDGSNVEPSKVFGREGVRLGNIFEHCRLLVPDPVQFPTFNENISKFSDTYVSFQSITVLLGAQRGKDLISCLLFKRTNLL